MEDVLSRLGGYIATAAICEQDEVAPYPRTIKENPGQA
jgi:hypothetical protein